MKAISLRLDEQTLQDIKKVSSIYNIPTSDLIRKGIKMILEAKKSEAYYRLTADIEETTQKETDEIIERLNKYNDDELEIAEKESGCQIMKQEFIIDFIIRKPAKSFFKKHENIKEKFKNNIILHFKGQRNIDIKKLIGYSDLFRMRINSYRVIYKVINNKIILIDVIDADNRGDIY